MQRRTMTVYNKGFVPSNDPHWVKRQAARRKRAYQRAKLPVGPVRVPPTMNWRPATEVKTVDTANLELIPGTAAAPVVLFANNIIQGASPYQRIGRRISLLSYSINGSFQLNPDWTAGLAVADNICRLVVVYDRQPAGTSPPPWADIFQDTDTTGANFVYAMAMRNENNKDRFLVLESRMFYVPQMVAEATTAGFIANYTNTWGLPAPGLNEAHNPWNPLCINSLKKLNGLTTEYQTSTNSIGDVTTGTLLMYIVSTSAFAGNAAKYPLRFQGTFRTRYIDV